MSSKFAIDIKGISKSYHIYDKPQDRLKQFFIPKFASCIGKSKKSYFREFWALKNISFQVLKGETFGIIGKNGSGKSTLLQLIAGILNPSSGSINVNGKIAAMLELGSGFNPEFTGRENVYMSASIFGLSKKEIDKNFKLILDFSDLHAFIDQPIKTYSTGMVARLAFATSIHIHPDILIIDEALSVGDVGFQLKCMLKLKQLKLSGTTIIFVSHDTGSIIRLCDRVIVLHDGEILPCTFSPIECVKLYEKTTRNFSSKDESLITPKKISPNNTYKHKSYQTELQGISEERFGSRDAEYLQVDFVAPGGNITNIFDAGAEIVIVAFISSKKNFRSVVTGFTLKSKTGVDVWGDNNLFSNTPISLKKGLNKISYKFTLNLPAGDYFLYVGLADIESKRIELDQRWPIRRLSVISSRQQVGIVYAPANISVETYDQ